jgi:hypothetical protein
VRRKQRIHAFDRFGQRDRHTKGSATSPAGE